MYDKSKVHVLILAGGKGARFNNETVDIPKPLIEVAGKPILGHIMDLFAGQGFKNFTILGGYQWEKLHGYLQTRYPQNAAPRDYLRVYGSMGGKAHAHLFNTGEESSTGERLMRLAADMWPPNEFLGGSDFFLLTYGDGLCNVNVDDLIETHLTNRLHKREEDREPIVTLTAVNPPGRFGVLNIGNDGRVDDFSEKGSDDWINGGFMVVDHGVVPMNVPNPLVDDDENAESFETGALPRLARDGNLFAYTHNGYWRCMDTRRDLERIEQDVKEHGGGLPWLKTVLV